MSEPFPLFTARGTPSQLGQQHGEQARGRIAGLLAYLEDTLHLSRQQMQARALTFLPLFERHCPHLVEEIHGLAAGAAISFAEALCAQIRGELAHASTGGCTTFVLAPSANRTGGVLIGQNSDIEPELDAFAYVLRLEPIDRPALLLWTFGGMIGYHGINAAGVGHFANSLGGGPRWRPGLPHYPIKRLMLEQSTLPEVFQLLERLPVCSSGNYVLCDGAGRIVDVELTPEGVGRIEANGRGFLGHANHFLCSPHACGGAHPVDLPDSLIRQRRIDELLEGAAEPLSVEDMKRILADHEGHPTAICRHPHAGADHPMVSARARTAASLIAEPAAGRMHISRGNPCENVYTTYHLRQAYR